MKGAIVRKAITSSSSSFSIRDLIKPVLIPIIFGIYGFLLLLFFLIFGKFISYLVGHISEFSIDLQIVATSLAGFVLFYLIKLIEIIRGKQS